MSVYVHVSEAFFASGRAIPSTRFPPPLPKGGRKSAKESVKVEYAFEGEERSGKGKEIMSCETFSPPEGRWAKKC